MTIDDLSVHIIKKGIKEDNPKLLKLIEKPYRSPKGYEKWENEVLAYMAKSFDPYNNDRVSNYSINVSNSLINHKFPTYYVSQELTIALWNTLCNLKAEDLNIAQPSALFMLPNNLIKTPDGDPLTSIAVVSTRKNKLSRWLYETYGDGLLATSPIVILSENRTYWYAIHNRSAENTGDHPQDDYEEYLLHNNGLPQELNNEDEVKFLDKYRSLVFNLMFILETKPELIYRETSGLGFGSEKQIKFRNPIWLGKDYKIQYLKQQMYIN